MLSFPPSVRIFIATRPIDGRKGVDSLAAIIRSVFLHDVFSGFLYVFFSRRCDRVRVVYWDRSGFAMWSKKLQRGRFHAPLSPDGQIAVKGIEAADLALILEGIDVSDARRRPRWIPETRRPVPPDPPHPSP